MLAFFRRLFPRRKSASTRTSEKQPDLDEILDRRLKTLRKQLEDFLITRRVTGGEIRKTAAYRLTKTNPEVYRLESKNCSLLIATGPFLALQDQRITGLLLMSESDLCEALASGKHIRDFLLRSRSLRGKSRPIYEKLCGRRTPEDFGNAGIDDLADWEPSDIYQMLIRSNPNTLAHVLLHIGPAGERKLRMGLSAGLKKMLLSEFDSLPVTGRQTSNPHSKLRSLREFEVAITEFESAMESYRREKKHRQLRAGNGN